MHRLYVNEDITVFWDSEKCFHAKKCVTGCPEAFDITRKPWIDISRAPTDKVWQAVSKCPSGGLTCTYNHNVKVVFEDGNNTSAAYFGDDRIGECEYRETDAGWDIYHTGVAPEYGGKKIAKRLVYAVVQEAERKGKGVIPTCSYAAEILK